MAAHPRKRHARHARPVDRGNGPLYGGPDTLLICDIVDPITKEAYSRDPRGIAKKAEAYLKSTGIGDTVYIGPEPEFFVFDDIRYSLGPDHSFYHLDSR